MTRHEIEVKERYLESFNSTVALYYVLKSNSMSLRAKQTVYRAGEIEQQPLDFLIDVELKAKRLLGQPYYDLFLRTVYNENTEVLPEYMRVALGKVFAEYNLGPDGAYSTLYFVIKNSQVRSYMKGQNGDIDRSNDGAVAPSTTA
jgi:hypothetical protein